MQRQTRQRPLHEEKKNCEIYRGVALRALDY
jgi:hypothetical protein